MVDAVVDDAPQSLQELDPRIAKVIPGGVVPDLLRDRDRGGTEETAAAGGFRLIVHINSPSSPRSILYSPTLRARAKGPPATWAVPHAGEEARSAPPARRPS